MKVGADGVVAIAVIGGAGLLAYLAYRKLQGLGDTVSSAATAVSDFGLRLWSGPADAAASYQSMLDNTRANPGAFPNYAIDPADMIPAGYRLNQWGGFEKIFTSGGGGDFTGNGATGGW